MSKIICLDAGHGGNDSGAVGNGIKEKDVVLKVVLKVGEFLEKQGFEVIYTRKSDKYIPLKDRCRIANNKNADLFISVHINSASNISARGTETLCYSKNMLAELVHKHLIKNLGLRDRGIKERKDLAVLNGTQMTAILCELGFLSNKAEAELMKTDEFINNSAEAIFMGVCDYFGVTVVRDEVIEEKEGAILKKNIGVVINGEKGVTQGYFADNRNLFTADFIRQLGFDVGYNTDTKEVIVNPRELKLSVDGVETTVETVNINGHNFVPVRSLANAVGFDVMSENRKVYLKSRKN